MLNCNLPIEFVNVYSTLAQFADWKQAAIWNSYCD